MHFGLDVRHIYYLENDIEYPNKSLILIHNLIDDHTNNSIAESSCDVAKGTVDLGLRGATLYGVAYRVP